MQPVTRIFTSDLCQLAEMREWVRDACRSVWGAKASSEAIDMLELALDEAATNIILHAYQKRQGQPIEITVEVDADRASVSLYHAGCAFDPGSIPPPSFDGTRESGFGLFLIRQSVDEVEYLRDERGRCGIRLVKKRDLVPQRS